MNCLTCGREFEPRRHDQRCCDSKCRARLSHNPEVYKILNAEPVGDHFWVFTAMIHGFAVRGFTYNDRYKNIFWPVDKKNKPIFLSYGPYQIMKERKDKGLSIPSARLLRLVQKFIDQHDPNLLRKPVQHVKRRPPGTVAYCPDCDHRVRQPDWNDDMLECVGCHRRFDAKGPEYDDLVWKLPEGAGNERGA